MEMDACENEVLPLPPPPPPSKGNSVHHVLYFYFLKPKTICVRTPTEENTKASPVVVYIRKFIVEGRQKIDVQGKLIFN